MIYGFKNLFAFEWLCLHDYLFVFCLCRQRVDSRADLGDFEICNRYNIDNTGLVCKFLLSSSLQLTSIASQVWEIGDICLYKILSSMSTMILRIIHTLLLPVLKAMFWIPVAVAILLSDIVENYGQMCPHLQMQRLQNPRCWGWNHSRNLLFITLIKRVRFNNTFQNKVKHESQAQCQSFVYSMLKGSFSFRTWTGLIWY